MIKVLAILWNSFKMALQELKVNKLRTFLSLFGITIGIFCIIGVLATIDSLKSKIKNDLSSLGSNTIYVDKWSYGGGGDGGNDYPWWKYMKRPSMKYEEMEFIQKKSDLTANAAFFISRTENFNYEENILKGVTYMVLHPILIKFNPSILLMVDILRKPILKEAFLMV